MSKIGNRIYHDYAENAVEKNKAQIKLIKGTTGSLSNIKLKK